MAAISNTARDGIYRLRQQLTATPPRRRALKIFFVLFCLWVVFCLFAWLAGPALLRNLATDYVADEFSHTLVIQDLRINPLKLAVTVDGMSLADSAGREIVGFRSMVVDVDTTSLVRAMAILDAFRLDGLTLNVERLNADRFNFSDLADRLAARFAAQNAGQADGAANPDAVDAAAAESGGVPVYFLIRHLDINDAALRFADHTRKPVYESWVRPLNLRMDDLTSRPDREAPYSFEATLGSGGTLSWQGDVTLEPLRSKGAITVAGFGLTAAYDYIKDSFGFALPEGALDARIDYVADFSGTQSVLRVEDGRMEIKGLAVTDLASAPLFAFDSTVVSGVRADLMKSTATVSRFETRGGRVFVVLDENGVSNVERALLPRTAPAVASSLAPDVQGDAAGGIAVSGAAVSGTAVSGAAVSSTAVEKSGGQAAPPETVWRVNLETLAVRDYLLDFTDRSTAPDVQLRLLNVDFEARSIRLPDWPAIPFTLTGLVDGDGRFGVSGEYTLGGGIVDADVDVQDLPLTPVSPYLAGVGRITLLSGTANWKGHLRGEDNLVTRMLVTGDGGLRDVSVRDDVQKTRLASLRELAIESLRFEDQLGTAGTHQQQLSMKKLTLAGLDVDVAVDTKGVSNLQRVMDVPLAAAKPSASPKNARQKTAASSAGVPPAPPMAIRLDTLVIRDGKLNVRDDSPDLAFNAQLSAFSGRIDGISTDPKQRATVQLEGMINRYAPLSVNGTVNPLAAESFADVQVRLARLDLSALTPYTVTYIAYPLARGNMGLELDWKIADRKFKAQNRVLLKGLALGEKRAAPRAVKVPVKLGVALLTNREGDADLNVPAYGELDDPQFRYGKVIWQALGNLITRAATAPFAALGNFGAAKPDVVDFVAGETALPPAEEEKLRKVATSLVEKPLLVLAITGAASVDSDRQALQKQRLALNLRRAFLETSGKRGVTVEQVELNDEQRGEMLAKLYRDATGQRLDALRDNAGKPLAVDERNGVAEQTLLATLQVDDGALRELARERSRKVKDTLLAAGLEEARLVIVDGKVVVVGGGTIPTLLALETR